MTPSSPSLPPSGFTASTPAATEAATRDMVHDVHRVVGLGHYQIYVKTDGTLRYRAADADDALCWATFSAVPQAHRRAFQRVIDAFHIVTSDTPRELDAFPWAADVLESIDSSV